MFSGNEVCEKPTQLPDAAGVYFVLVESGHRLFDLQPEFRTPGDRSLVGGRELVYIGASTKSLRSRVLAHLAGNSQASSLRRYIGMLLEDELILKRRMNRRYKYDFGEGERRLTVWMKTNCHVSFLETQSPMKIEESLIKLLQPTLNLMHRRLQPSARALMTAYNLRRREALGNKLLGSALSAQAM